MFVCRLTEQDALCLALSQDGLKYSQQGFGQLLLQVVLCVYGNVVLQHIDGVLKQHVEESGLSSGLNVLYKKRGGDAQMKQTSFTDNQRRHYRPRTSCMLLLPLQP